MRLLPKEIIIAEAQRAIKVNDGDKQVKVPTGQTIVRSLAVTASKGNTRAQRLFAELFASSFPIPAPFKQSVIINRILTV